MKRVAVLILIACLGLAGPLRAGDPAPGPTVPTIAAPVLTRDVLTSANGTGPATVVHPRGPGERLPTPRLVAANGQPYGAVAADPPPPAMAVTGPAAGVPAPPPAGFVPAADCGGAGCSSSDCWAKFKAWLCFRQTPVKPGLTPVPYAAPLGMQFPCVSAAGCGTGGFGPAGCAKAGPACNTCGPRVGAGLPCRGTAGGCSAVAADPALPGYRFAAPVNAPATAPTAAAPVVTTAFKPPTPAAAPSPTGPYKEPTWSAAPRK